MQAKRIPVSAADVVRLIHYDAKTGVVTNRVDRSSSAKAGKAAGTVVADGRTFLTIRGHRTFLHRWIWLYCYGYLPQVEIDHIDGDHTNHRISNLRLCIGDGVNLHNLHGPHRNNKVGLLGVSQKKNRNCFRAAIRPPGGDPIHIGSYPTAELAAQAYLNAKRRLHKFGML